MSSSNILRCSVRLVTSRPSTLVASSRPSILVHSTLLPLSGRPLSTSCALLAHVRIQKPNRAPWYRQRLLAVTKPKWKTHHETTDDLWKQCEHAATEEEREVWQDHTNQLEKLYAREMVQLFEKSKMIVFFHTNPISDHKFRAAWQDGRRIGAELKRYNHRIGKYGLRGTQWENCLHFFMNYKAEYLEQSMLFFPELNPKALIKYERKVAEFHILGAVVENRILSRGELISLVDMPSLDEMRAELSALLQSPAREVTRLLGANQQQLSTNLQQYIDDNSKK